MRKKEAASRTKRDLFSGVWWEGESKKSHAGDECAWNDEIKDVVQRTTTNVNREYDVNVLLRTTFVLLHVSLRRQPCVPYQAKHISFFFIYTYKANFFCLGACAAIRNGQDPRSVWQAELTLN